MVRSPSEVVRTYLEEVWHKKNMHILPELLAESSWRHDTYDVDNQLICVSLEEQLQRVQDGLSLGDWEFTVIELLEDGPFCTLVYDSALDPKNATIRESITEKYAPVFDVKGHLRFKGIEVFKVRDGKIIEIWNAQHYTLRGSWGDTQTD